MTGSDLTGFGPRASAALIGYWPFEEGSGTTAADSSGNGFTGTLAGTPLPTWVPGVAGGALDFAGGANTSQVQVSTPTSSALQMSGSMTLTAWVWADTVNNAARIVTKSPNTASIRGWGLNMETASGGILRLQIATNNSGIASCGITGAVPTGVWFHLAGVYDAGAQTMKLYTNGTLGQTRTAANGVSASQYNNTTIPVTIGTFYNAPTGTRWDGKIDEVRIYDEALTDAQVAALAFVTPTPLNFTLEPTNRIVVAGQPATFTTAFTGSPASIQWYENNVPIGGANFASYIIPSTTVAMNNYQYKVVITNNGPYSITSSNATLTVISDTNPPALVSVVCATDPSQITVVFNEALDPTSAATADNYKLSAPGGPPTITGASIGGDAATVILSTSAPLTEGTNYTLTVSNVWDIATPPNVISNAQMAFQYNSLVGYWRFEEGSGTATADSSGYNSTGTLLNGPAWVSGKAGQYALSFDGSNDRVDVGNPSVLQLTGPMTLAAWAYPTSITAGGRIITKGSSSPRGWSLNVENIDVWRLQVAVNSTTLISCSVTGVLLNAWTHVAGVFDPNDGGGPIMKVYTNGVLAATETLNVPIGQYNSGLNVSIGARPDGTTPWSGDLDEVRVYARALSDSEVAALATVTVPPVFLSPILLNNQLILNWTGSGQLQSAPAVTGGYTNITPRPNPPYTNSIVPGQKKFFRLLAP